MATLTASSVTIIRSWTEGGVTGKERIGVHARVVTLSSPGNGGTTNNIPASIFGLSVIEEASSAVASDNTIILARPSYNGANLLLYNVEQATDANRSDPADFISTTFQVILKGY